MNFGSEHVYLYDSSDEEYIPEEELSRGVELSLKWVDHSQYGSGSPVLYSRSNGSCT